MSDQKCSRCSILFKDGEDVYALIETKFKGLKSKIHFALERPTNCLEVYHRHCRTVEVDDDNKKSFFD